MTANPVTDYNRAGQELLDCFSDATTRQAQEDMKVLQRNYFRERVT